MSGQRIEVDATGLECPMPLLKAKQAINRAEIGDSIAIEATDSGSWRDFQIFCEQSGHKLLDAQELPNHYFYLIKKMF